MVFFSEKDTCFYHAQTFYMVIHSMKRMYGCIWNFWLQFKALSWELFPCPLEVLLFKKTCVPCQCCAVADVRKIVGENVTKEVGNWGEKERRLYSSFAWGISKPQNDPKSPLLTLIGIINQWFHPMRGRWR